MFGWNLLSRKRDPRHTDSNPLPWAPGYTKNKNRFIDATLRDPSLMARFRAGGELPAGFGPGIDERAVEYPWVLSRLAPAGMILDAGSTLNAPFLLNGPLLADRRILIYTFDADWIGLNTRVSYLFGDLRDMILRDALFETIICISTLEHIGMSLDLKAYSAARPYPQAYYDSYRLALNEFHRVLKPGGQLLLTAPYGRREDHGWLQQFDAAGVEAIKNGFAGDVAAETYYRYSAEGWQAAKPAECAELRYFNIHATPNFDPDFAAAARGVACLEFVKG
jgi:SAM-dependent methyltransferase